MVRRTVLGCERLLRLGQRGLLVGSIVAGAEVDQDAATEKEEDAAGQDSE